MADATITRRSVALSAMGVAATGSSPSEWALSVCILFLHRSTSLARIDGCHRESPRVSLGKNVSTTAPRKQALQSRACGVRGAFHGKRFLTKYRQKTPDLPRNDRDFIGNVFVPSSP